MKSHTSPTTNHLDDRAVSEILGAMLVFGLLIALLLLVQITMVPTWNHQAELAHSERVQDDMGELGNTIEGVQYGDTPASVSIDLGLRYTARPFLVNPSPAEGTLRTSDLGSVSITNAQASGEVGDFWDGSTISHPTQAITYRHGYNEFQDAPREISYAHGTVASNYDHGATVLRQPRQLVSDNQIDLTAISGTLDRQGVDRSTVTATPMARSPRTISVSGIDDGAGGADDIEISLETTLPESTWQELLAGELENGHLLALEYDTSTDPATVTLVLDGSVTYDLRTASVGVGENPERTAPTYLERVQGGDSHVSVGSTDRLAVEVRDQFNAPKSGVDVTYEVVSGSGSFRGEETPGDGIHTVVSGTDGQAGVAFTPLSSGQVVVEARAELNDQSGTQAEEMVTFAMTTQVGPEDESEGDIINPRDPRSITLDSVDQTQRTVTVTFENLANTPRQWTGLRIPFTSKQAGQRIPLEVQLTPEEKDTVPYIIGDDFEAITPTPLTFGPAGTDEATRTITIEMPAGQALQRGDFVVITALDGANRATTYFVSAQA